MIEHYAPHIGNSFAAGYVWSNVASDAVVAIHLRMGIVINWREILTGV